MSQILNRGQLVIQEDLSLADLERMRRSGVVAVDNEMTGLNPHRDLLCLMQICDTSGQVTLLRTSDWQQATFLRELMLDEQVLKIFHFALVDCSFILKQLGVMPSPAYCTKIASKLVRTYTQEHGLGALVRELFGVQLDKSRQTTDWLAENLMPEQLDYAANDVAWLIEVRTRLEEKLARRGFLPTGISYNELNQQCQAFLPSLVHLQLNGWRTGTDGDPASVFAH